LLLAACATAEQPLAPRVRLVDIMLYESTLFEQRMRVDLNVTNPNNFDLPLEGLAFTLELNGNPLVEGATAESVVIPRLGEARLPVLATTSLFDVVRQVLAFGQGEALSYRLSGRAYLAGVLRLSLPFEAGGTLELRSGQGSGRSLTPL
jgi:LEA14-like dessication related protein